MNSIMIIVLMSRIGLPLETDQQTVDRSIKLQNQMTLTAGALERVVLGDPKTGCDICSLPADPGPCEGLCARFYFDPCTQQCEAFVYGCCEGNANNFETLEACASACPPEGDVCYLPADVGPCDGVCPRYFFNACSGDCELFDFGCCEGNANNFETLEACRSACPATQGVCGDLNNDGVIDIADLLVLLASWGPCAGCPADLDDNGVVNIADLLLLLGNWG